MARPWKYTVTQLERNIKEYFDQAKEDGRPYTLTGLALKIGITKQQLNEWSKREDFKPAIDLAKERIQADIEENALLGKYREGFAIMQLKNFYGWRDKQELESTVNQTVDAKIKMSFEEELKAAKEFFEKE